MSTRQLPVWAQDIPLLEPETRAISERAVNQQWAEQLQREAAERARWRQVLTPDHSYTVRGPYRRRRRRANRYALPVAACVVLLGVLYGLGGCSLVSDSEIEELMALDLADAIHQAGEKR